MSKLVEPLDLFVTILSTSKLEMHKFTDLNGLKKNIWHPNGNFPYFPDLE